MRQANWCTVKLGDYISVLTDYHANGSYKKLKENVTLLDVPDHAIMIRTTNFEKDDFEIDLKFIDRHAYDFLAKSKVLPGDILMNKIANAGSVYLMPDLKRPVSLAMNLFLIRMKKERAEHKFVYYYLKENEEYVKLYSVGTAAKTITKQAVRDLQINLPPLLIQRKIAAILSAYDDLIENNQRRIKILEEMAQNLYREWFVKFRFPKYEKFKMVDSPLGKIPEGWELNTLGDQIEIRKGKNITKNTITEGSVPVVAGGLKPAYFHNRANTRQPVITVSASGANAGFVNLYHEQIWASDCSFVDTEVNSYIFYYFLMLKHRQIEISGLQRGSAQPHVYPKDLMRLESVNVPSDLLADFEQAIGPVFRLVKILSEKNFTLRRTRDLLLPKLISGEVDVSELDISVTEEAET